MKTLFPNMPETLEAAKVLVKDGFDVMVYCSDDPIRTHAGGYRLCGSDAACLSDWFWDGDFESMESFADHRANQGAYHR